MQAKRLPCLNLLARPVRKSLMSDSVYAVYGASGLGRQVMPLARKQLQKQGISIDNLFFVDDHPPSAELNGHKILSRDEFFLLPVEIKFVFIAIDIIKIRELFAYH